MMLRVKPGMSIEEIRQVWLARSDVKSEEIMSKYRERRDRDGGYGHEGLGVYGDYQERVAREKVRLAVKLLRQAEIEVTYGTIHKVTKQSTGTIANYWAPPRPVVPEVQQKDDDSEPPPTIRFPGNW